MNAGCYKIVFSKRLGALVAVGEHTSGQGKAAGTGIRSAASSSHLSAWGNGFIGSLKMGVIAAALTFISTGTSTAAGLAPTALPTGAAVNAGNVAISTQGAAMTIQQTSDKASVNWNAFNIGSGASVNVQQNSVNSVLLNRVVGNDPSQILGKLTANGQVVLVNPNGIVFGKDGSVAASAFTASTFGISEKDFANGNYHYARNGSTAAVTVENGATLSATAPGGYVALIGASVDNQGVVSSKGGSVLMVAGEKAALPEALTHNVSVPLSGKVRLELAPSAINASVANSGTITTEGGQVLMQAAALSDAVASITHTGVIDTTGTQGGAVTLQADQGNIQVSGSVKANSTGAGNAGGDVVMGRDVATGVLTKTTDVSGAKLESVKGFVETSGDVLSTTGTRVKAGEWLLDPYNITIAASGATGTPYASSYTSGADSIILASDISANLTAGTSVTLATGAGGTSTGNIAVNESINKTGGGDATLTLQAHGSISVAAGKTITSNTGKLNVVFNSDSDGAGGGAIIFNTGSGITSKGGDITLGGGTALNGTGSAAGDGISGYAGISLSTAAFDAGGGNIAMTGTTFKTALANTPNVHGIVVTNGSIKTTGAGTITMNGYSTTTTATLSKAIQISGATITGGSTGTVSLIGDSRSAAAAGDYLYGVALGTNAVVTSLGGDIAVTGYGGNGSGGLATNIGVSISGAKVAAVGAGKVTISGTGGQGTVGSNIGVYIDNASTVVSSQGADINIIGQGGNGAKSVGVLIGGGTVGVAAGTTSANVIMTTDSVQLQSTTINSGTGTTTIQNKTAGTLVNVGGADVLNTTPLTLGITNAEMNLITAGTLKIGSTTSGAMTTTAAVTTAATTGNVYLQSGSTLTASNAFTSGAGLLLQTTGGAISTTAALAGTNVSLDNTGGTINWGTGALTAGANSGSATNAINIASSITATGNVNILGNVATTTNTGVNLTSAGSITSSGTAATINITSNGNLVNAAAIKDTGATGTGSNINLTSTSGKITGAGAIGDTNNKNASVTFTQSGTSTYNGAINAANFTKAGAGDLTLDSWIAPTLVATNVSNAYAVKAGRLTLEPGATYAQLNPASVNVENASTFAISTSANGWWKNTAFNFTGGLGGGIMNLGGNPIAQGSTTNTFSTSGGATNTITGVLNANTADVNFNLTPATSGTTLLDGSFAALAFTQSSTTYGLGSGGAGAGTVNMSGGGNLLIKDKFRATTFNINAGNVQVGDGTAATSSTTATLDATNISIAAGSKLTFNRAEAYTNASAITGSGSLIQAGPGVVTLTGNSSAFAGATTVNAGKTLAIGTGGSLGAAGSTLTLTDSASNLSFTNTSGTSTVASTISGPGTVTENGAGGTGVLLANNTYTGTTTITAGILQVGNGGTTGSLGTGLVTDNSALVFNRSNTMTVANTISGTGTLTQSGTGTSILTGNNSYSGATTVSGGTLQVGNGGTTGTLGTGAVILSNNANLSYVRAASTTIANTISGAGNVSASITGAANNLTVDHAINLTGGTVNLVTDGNLSVTQAISTTNTSSSAIFLEAGKSTAAGTATGGDVTLSGSGALTAGSGARITIATGSVAGSTGLGVLAGNSRFNSDELTTNYSTTTAPLGSGLFAIYRESPILTAAFTTASKTYDGKAYSGNNGLTYTGLVNGDTNAMVNTTTTGTSQGAKNAGTYTLMGTGTSDLGYTVVYTSGILTVNKANLSLSGTRVYDAGTTFAGQHLIATGVAGETFTVTGNGDASNLASKNVQTAQALSSVTGLVLGTSANGGLSDNYNALSTSASSVSVTPKSATVSATATALTYNASTQHQQAETTSGFIAGDVINVTGQASGKNAGTYASNLALGGPDLGNYSVTVNNAKLVIGKAALTATGNSSTVTYNGADQSVSGFTVSGLLGSDTVAGLSSISAAGATGKNAGDYTNTVTAGTETNYTVNTVNGTLQIGRANLSLSGTRIYDAGTTFAGQYLTATGVAGETFAVTGAGAVNNLSSKNVQALQALSNLDGLALGGSTNGGLSSNYNDLTTLGSKVSVTPKSATVNATANTTTYNASTQHQMAETSNGFIAGDLVTVTGQASGKNAGTYASNLALGGPDLGNYSVTINNANLVIGKAALTATGNSSTVTYNGADQSVSGFTVSGLLGNDTVGSLSTLSASGATAKNAGTYSNIVSAGTETNYTVKTIDGNLKIDRANLVLSGTRVYDAGTTFAGQYLTATGVAGETFTVTGNGDVSNLANKNIQVSQTLSSVTGLSLGNSKNGGQSDNYNTISTAGSSVNVTAKNATITGTSTNVTYNGTNQMQTSAILEGFFDSDVASGTVGVTGLATGRNAGSYTSNLSATGADVSNYNINVTNNTLTIHKADLSVTAQAVTKTYDGTKTATGTASVGALAGAAAGETVSNSGSQIFSDKNVGIGNKLVKASGVTIKDSTNADVTDNYNITYIDNNTSTINKKAISLSGITAANKTYDGTTAASVSTSAAVFNDQISGDKLTVSSSGSFSDKNAAAGKTVTLTHSLGGEDLGNYSVTTQSTTTADISKKAIFLSGITAANKNYDGTNSAVITAGAIATGVGTETLAISGTGTFSDKNAADGKTVTVADITTLTKTNATGDWRNYNLTSTGSATTTANINKKDVTLDSISAASKVYDGTDAADITTGTISGTVGSETLTMSGKGKFSSSAPGTNKLVTVADVKTLNKTNGTGDWNNYNLSTIGSKTTTATITAVPPAPPAPSPSSTSSSSAAARVKIPLGSGNPFQLASVDNLLPDTCSANNLESCFCEASTVNSEISICYEK